MNLHHQDLSYLHITIVALKGHRSPSVLPPECSLHSNLAPITQANEKIRKNVPVLRELSTCLSSLLCFPGDSCISGTRIKDQNCYYWFLSHSHVAQQLELAELISQNRSCGGSGFWAMMSQTSEKRNLSIFSLTGWQVSLSVKSIWHHYYMTSAVPYHRVHWSDHMISDQIDQDNGDESRHW